VLTNVYLGTLYLLGDIWSRTVPDDITAPVPKYQAIWAEIKNAAKEGETVGPANKIRAELVINYGGRDEEHTPLPWIDEYFNTVNLQFGDVRYVVLGVGRRTAHDLGDWRVVINHRDFNDSSPRVSRMDYERELLQRPHAQLRLNLLQVTSGRILRSFEGEYRWPDGYGRPTMAF